VGLGGEGIVLLVQRRGGRKPKQRGGRPGRQSEVSRAPNPD